MPKVICQKWEEAERNWGCQPDGYSLHLTEEDRLTYLQAYWDQMPDTPPEVYSRPEGVPHELEVDDATFAEVKKGHGIRVRERRPDNGAKVEPRTVVWGAVRAAGHDFVLVVERAGNTTHSCELCGALLIVTQRMELALFQGPVGSRTSIDECSFMALQPGQVRGAKLRERLEMLRQQDLAKRESGDG